MHYLLRRDRPTFLEVVSFSVHGWLVSFCRRFKWDRVLLPSITRTWTLVMVHGRFWVFLFFFSFFLNLVIISQRKGKVGCLNCLFITPVPEGTSRLLWTQQNEGHIHQLLKTKPNLYHHFCPYRVNSWSPRCETTSIFVALFLKYLSI